jgi:methylmalonyl-CoA mutase, N-terminal domain
MFNVSEKVKECSFCGKKTDEKTLVVANEHAGICAQCLSECVSLSKGSEEREKIRVHEKEWDDRSVKKSLAKKPERKSEFHTTSVKPISRLYTPANLDQCDYADRLGFPSEFPFTRGVQPTMYRCQFWTMRQYAGFGSAKETNERFKFLLEQGQTGLSVAFDLPTQMGYDSDHKKSYGEVGRVGVAIDTLADMEILFDGIPLDKVTTSMTINAPAAVVLGMYTALAEKRKIPLEKLGGTTQNDILKEYVARGTYIFPPLPSLRLCTDLIQFCSTRLPQWNPISISGYHMREAGATAAQELAFTLLNGLTYVKAAQERGLDIDEFAGRLSFFFASHNNIFEEIAKFRASRRLWARFMEEKGARKDRSKMLRFHTQTGGSTLTAQQPLNNVIRVAFQALAAVLGGTQSLHTNSYDEALCLPTEESVQTALRTQQIIAYESGVTDTVDPLGGSYYIEFLTDSIERHVLDYVARINERGGILKSIEDGYIQREIHNSAYQYQLQLEKNEEIIVGVNKYQAEEKDRACAPPLKEGVEAKQKEALSTIKKERDNGMVKKALEDVRDAARGTENLLPPIIDSVKAYATIGEICDTMREIYGEYRETRL